MTMPAYEIEAESLSLPREARVRLILRLLDSVDDRTEDTPSGNSERAWLREADHRYHAYQRGEEEAIPAEQAFVELRDDDI